jgi:hypothetical protein
MKRMQCLQKNCTYIRYLQTGSLKKDIYQLRLVGIKTFHKVHSVQTVASFKRKFSTSATLWQFKRQGT